MGISQTVNATRERRRAARKAARAVVEVWPCGRDAAAGPLAAAMVDVSAGGVGLVVGHDLRAGADFLLPLDGVARRSAGLYTVVSSRPAGTDVRGVALFRVGAQLVRVLRGELLARKAPLMAKAAAAAAAT